MHSVRLAQRREQLVGGAARSGDLLLLDLPDLCEMAPRRGIVDAPVAGELIGFLPVLAAALSVALPFLPRASATLMKASVLATPCACCSGPRPVSTIGLRAHPSIRAAWTSCASGTPVMRSTRSGQ